MVRHGNMLAKSEVLYQSWAWLKALYSLPLMVPDAFPVIGFSCRFCIPYPSRERKGLRHRVRWTTSATEEPPVPQRR